MPGSKCLKPPGTKWSAGINASALGCCAFYMDNKKEKWYKRNKVIAALIILVFPLGCFLMIKYQHTWYTKFKAKILAIGLACFLAEAGTAAYIVHIQTSMVWIDDTAAHYHRRKNCSNMDHPYRVTLEEAKKLGRTACKDCYH